MYARVAYSLPCLGVFLTYGAKLSQLLFFCAVCGFYGVPVVGYAVRIFCRVTDPLVRSEMNCYSNSVQI